MTQYGIDQDGGINLILKVGWKCNAEFMKSGGKNKKNDITGIIPIS
jgi:hypothetical protein